MSVFILCDNSVPTEEVRNIKSDELPEKLDQDENDHFPHTLESVSGV